MTSLTNELFLAKRVTTRKLAKIAGSIISMKFVMGDITQLKSRAIYEAIENKISWDTEIDTKEIVWDLTTGLDCPATGKGAVP